MCGAWVAKQSYTTAINLTILPSPRSWTRVTRGAEQTQPDQPPYTWESESGVQLKFIVQDTSRLFGVAAVSQQHNATQHWPLHYTRPHLFVSFAYCTSARGCLCLTDGVNLHFKQFLHLKICHFSYSGKTRSELLTPASQAAQVICFHWEWQRVKNIKQAIVNKLCRLLPNESLALFTNGARESSKISK